MDPAAGGDTTPWYYAGGGPVTAPEEPGDWYYENLLHATRDYAGTEGPEAPPPRNAAQQTPAGRSPVAPTTRRPAAPPGNSASISVGLPDSGELLNGQRLPLAENLFFVPSETRGRNGGRFFGTTEMVAFLQRTARTMKSRFRGSKLSVGELAAQRGGSIPGHRSHQNGRDVDLGLYFRDQNGQRVLPEEFVHVQENGESARGRRSRAPGLRFDAEANWALVETMLLDSRMNVQFIFIAEHLEDMMLEYARISRAPQSLRQRAQNVMREPEDHPHDNHFHVRVFCAANDRSRCQNDAPERPPYGYPESTPRQLEQARERAQRLGLGTERAGVTAIRRPPPANWLSAARGRSPQTLTWPIREGRYGRGFGLTRVDLPDVPHNGIDIGSPANAVVRAAADGLIVFAGEFRSFGNTVMILHPNRWLTVYAHNSRNTVIPGMVIRRSDPIALVGSTGISRGPHVHFEMRNNGSLVDPEPHLDTVRTWGVRAPVPQAVVNASTPDETPEGQAPPRPIAQPLPREGEPQEGNGEEGEAGDEGNGGWSSGVWNR